MLLAPPSAQRFIAEYKRVLLAIHRQSAQVEIPDGNIVPILAAARTKLRADSSLLEKIASDLAATGAPIEHDMLNALRSMQVGQWVYLRSTKRHAIFLDHAAENAYAVLGLTNTIEAIIGAPAVALETAVLEFDGCYVCDGIVESPVLLGPGYRKQFSAALAGIKKAGNFHASPSEP